MREILWKKFLTAAVDPLPPYFLPSLSWIPVAIRVCDVIDSGKPISCFFFLVGGVGDKTSLAPSCFLRRKSPHEEFMSSATRLDSLGSRAGMPRSYCRTGCSDIRDLVVLHVRPLARDLPKTARHNASKNDYPLFCM